MAQDPYGFPEVTTGEGTPSATSAMWCGVTALICGLLGPCTCYVSYFVAVPFAMAALWFGKLGLESGQPSERAAASAGLVSGGVSLVFTLILLSIFAMYAALLAFIVLAGQN